MLRRMLRRRLTRMLTGKFRPFAAASFSLIISCRLEIDILVG